MSDQQLAEDRGMKVQLKPWGNSPLLISDATFSENRIWRYDLRRVWDMDRGLAMFVGLNPSTADETKDDRTVRRCMNFAWDWDFGGLIMTNLFALMETQPSVMKTAEDPVGAENDAYLKRCALKAKIVVAAWGNDGVHRSRDQSVVQANLLGSFKVLRLTKPGNPHHPLYLPRDLVPLDPVSLRPAW